ncbi:MAG TPA: hypothetical protein VGR13_05180 [Actinomycetota bacterium]|nr:hypothetical protein [Actinomycetota bacterium]
MDRHPAHAPDESNDLNAVGGHCPRCLMEYRPGFHVCVDCGVPLVPGPAPSPVLHGPEEPDRGGSLAEPGEGPIDVAVVASLPWEEAWLMAGRLRTDGIAALVSPDDYTRYTYTPQQLFDVVVRKDQAAEARRIATRYVGR